MIDQGRFREAYLPKFEKHIQLNTDKLIKNGDWKTFFTEGSTKHDHSDTRIHEASGPMRGWVMGSPMSKIDINDGHSKRRFINYYACRVEYTKGVRKFGSKELMMKITKAGANSPNQLLSEIGMAYIELGDTAMASVPLLNGKPMIDTTSADNQPIFSTTHTFKSTALYPYANKATAYTALTSDSLYEHRNAIGQWRNNTNELMSIKPKKLIVGYTNRKKAYELLHSSEDSETTNRSTNAVKQLGLSFEVYERMATPSEWFLETDAENDFTFDFGWKPETGKGYDDKTGIHFITVDMALQHGVADPRRFFAVKAA